MTLTQTYEAQRDLLIGMAYRRGSSLVVQREYSYDELGRPTARNTARQGAVVNDVFAHNSRSELSSARVNGVSYGNTEDSTDVLAENYTLDDMSVTLTTGSSTTSTMGSSVTNSNTITNGFHGVDRGLCDIGHQISDCCCTTQRNIDSVRYDMATGFCNLSNTIQNTTRDIIDNQNANYRGILDFLTNDKIESLRSENQTLKFAASQSAQNAFITANQEAQTAELIRRLGRDCPVPAYVVPNPNCCYGNPVGIGYGNGYGGNGNCGCGC